MKIEIMTVEEMRAVDGVVEDGLALCKNNTCVFKKWLSNVEGEIIEVTNDYGNEFFPYRVLGHNWHIPAWAVKRIIEE